MHYGYTVNSTTYRDFESPAYCALGACVCMPMIFPVVVLLRTTAVVTWRVPIEVLCGVDLRFPETPWSSSRSML